MSKQCGLLSALWNPGANMPLCGSIVYVFQKTSLRVKESCFIENRLDFNKQNLSFHILNYSQTKLNYQRRNMNDIC